MARKADGWAIQLRVTLHGWLPNTPWIMKSVTNESRFACVRYSRQEHKLNNGHRSDPRDPNEGCEGSVLTLNVEVSISPV